MLSQTTEYALRATVCLSYSRDGLVSTSELAEMTKVPMNYLAKVLQLLAKSDIVVGRRGVGGGYRLIKTPEEVSILDVVNAIDPFHRIMSCPLGLENHSKTLCPLHKKLDETVEMLMNQLSGVSMNDLLTELGANRPLCNEEMTVQIDLTMDGCKTDS